MYRPRNWSNVVASKVNTEIWNGNYLSFHRMRNINLRETELLNLKATYATTVTCEKASKSIWGNIRII